ncbi:MAG: molybdenum ABC transporter ATP-binding protein [bacterium]|nr:molybdenum ABC transporter ATP-binding protein [bacterium]
MTSTALDVDVRLALDRFEVTVAFSASKPVTGIFGASGAGKTSLLEAVAGLRRGARGRIRLGDDVWLDSDARRFVPPERRWIGYVPQDGLLFPHLSVRANLLAGARRARRAGHNPERSLSTVAELLELARLLERDVVTLSGGERQRVSLGRALCSGARLLLLDEPLASLDLPLRRRLLPFLRRVRDELTVPMLLVSHDPIEVQALCDELIVLREGTVVARGEPRTVLRDPEVFPLAEKEGYENVLSGRPVRQLASTSVVHLGDENSGVELIVPRLATDGEVLVTLPANEILIATESPRGISARNVLAAKVTEIRSLGHLGLVTAELGEGVPPLVVEVTETTPAELGLELGQQVFLVIKATSCRLYGGSGEPRR